MTEIRLSGPDDMPALEALYPAAFPEEDLLPLVRKLVGRGDVLTLAAAAEGALVGHVCFTFCGVGDEAEAAALLGPLAVAPAHQRRGIGGALIREGLARAGARARHALVLGDPAYYGRFGFETERGVTPPYPLPDAWAEAWRGLPLCEGAPLAGSLITPAPWSHRSLWSDETA